MIGLKELRKKHELSQYGLASLIGDQQPNISAFESGRRRLTVRVANEVIKQLEDEEISGAELMVVNRVLAFKRYKENNDVGGMLGAAESVFKTISDNADTATEDAIKLLQELVGEIDVATKAEFHDDDRDFFGRVIKSADPDSDSRDLYGRRITPPDDYDEDDRDIFGRRITPLEDEQDEDIDDEDEDYIDPFDYEDDRDAFGRVMRR